jgi:phosphoglycerate dehydrogenase-like enzyme
MPVLLVHFNPHNFSEEQLEQIHDLAPDKEVIVTHDRAQVAEVLDEIEIAASWGPYEQLLKARNLRWLQQWGAGADWIALRPEFQHMDIVLTNTSGVHAIPISEHILALLLAFARDIRRAVSAQSRHEWRRSDAWRVFELAGKTLLLIGVGAIGTRTAEMASALGMRVLGVRRHPDETVPGVERVVGPGVLHQVLPEADFVVLTVPLTEETRNMIGQAELRAMKSSAYLVNIGRGDTINQSELITALQEGWIAGAGLDVLEEEPLPEDSPLWEMENVIITSHYAGATPHYMERATGIFMDNLRRYQAGEPLRNVVDKHLGY